MPHGVASGFGYLRILSDPPGATVSLDGSNVGTAPAVKAIGPGEYILTAQLRGRKTASRVVTVKEDVGLEVRIALPAQ